MSNKRKLSPAASSSSLSSPALPSTAPPPTRGRLNIPRLSSKAHLNRTTTTTKQQQQNKIVSALPVTTARVPRLFSKTPLNRTRTTTTTKQPELNASQKEQKQKKLLPPHPPEQMTSSRSRPVEPRPPKRQELNYVKNPKQETKESKESEETKKKARQQEEEDERVSEWLNQVERENSQDAILVPRIREMRQRHLSGYSIKSLADDVSRYLFEKRLVHSPPPPLPIQSPPPPPQQQQPFVTIVFASPPPLPLPPQHLLVPFHPQQQQQQQQQQEFFETRILAPNPLPAAPLIPTRWPVQELVQMAMETTSRKKETPVQKEPKQEEEEEDLWSEKSLSSGVLSSEAWKVLGMVCTDKNKNLDTSGTGLYSREKYQCKACGLRLENIDSAIQVHLDAHFHENKRNIKKLETTTTIVRGYMDLNEQEWIHGSTLPTKKTFEELFPRQAAESNAAMVMGAASKQVKRQVLRLGDSLFCYACHRKFAVQLCRDAQLCREEDDYMFEVVIESDKDAIVRIDSSHWAHRECVGEDAAPACIVSVPVVLPIVSETLSLTDPGALDQLKNLSLALNSLSPTAPIETKKLKDPRLALKIKMEALAVK